MYRNEAKELNDGWVRLRLVMRAIETRPAAFCLALTETTEEKDRYIVEIKLEPLPTTLASSLRGRARRDTCLKSEWWEREIRHGFPLCQTPVFFRDRWGQCCQTVLDPRVSTSGYLGAPGFFIHSSTCTDHKRAVCPRKQASEPTAR